MVLYSASFVEVEGLGSDGYIAGHQALTALSVQHTVLVLHQHRPRNHMECEVELIVHPEQEEAKARIFGVYEHLVLTSRRKHPELPYPFG